ncbi:MAG TPA: CPBP family intramembrane glutamic endopeptidase [Egibacteraceae bacterium]|nr:CPBP family intramembrane glutamic endopeptidase [Egibacteraceae bacterium]
MTDPSQPSDPFDDRPAPAADATAQPTADSTPARGVPPVGDVPWSVGDSLLVLLVWFLVLVGVVGLVVIPALQALLPEAAASAAALPVATGLLIVVTLAYVGSRYGGHVRRLFGSVPPTWGSVGYGVLAGVIGLVVFAFLLGNALALLARLVEGELPPIQEQFRQMAGQRQSVPLLVFGSVVVAPIAEELFYRGMLFTALRRTMPLWPAMGLSGALFALSHFQTGGLQATLLVILIIMPLGMFFAWIYERKGTLVVPIVAHAVFNLVQVSYLVQQGGAV